MINNFPQTSFEIDNTCINVYDAATNAKLNTYPGYKKAGVGLGIRDKILNNRIKNKMSFFSTRLNKEVICKIEKR